MNTYTVRSPGTPDLVTEADDWVTESGLIIFKDSIGRAVRAVAIADGTVVDCVYGDDEMFEARARLAAAHRTVHLAGIEAEVRRLSSGAD